MYCEVCGHDHPIGTPHEDDDAVDFNTFAGHVCGCGALMHASDTECARCWRERNYPEA